MLRSQWYFQDFWKQFNCIDYLLWFCLNFLSCVIQTRFQLEFWRSEKCCGWYELLREGMIYSFLNWRNQKHFRLVHRQVHFHNEEFIFLSLIWTFVPITLFLASHREKIMFILRPDRLNSMGTRLYSSITSAFTC